MVSLRVTKLVSMLVAAAFVSASLLVAADPASAASALFRLKRRWWFSQASSWTDNAVIPSTGAVADYKPSAVGRVYAGANTTLPPGFTAPQSFIKNTTYTFMCGPGTFQCYTGYPKSSGWYSYWNAKGSFRAENPNAPTGPTTVRVRTFGGLAPATDGYKTSIMGWETTTHVIATVMGMGNPAHVFIERTVTVATPPPTGMYTRLTPTEGGCINTATPADCPGTTYFGSPSPARPFGRYQAKRGGSMMIVPGVNRFGGTIRMLSGPNDRSEQRITYTTPYVTTVYWENTPLSQQAGVTKGEAIVGSNRVSKIPGIRFRLTQPDANYRQVLGNLTPGGSVACSLATQMSLAVRPPTNAGCKYYTKQAIYMATDAPYTTGMAQAWAPVGNTNTLQTTTGYDNRTPAGLNGTISMVQPSLTHTYRTSRSVIPDNPIAMSWSSARMAKMDFRFMPEPAGVAMLAAGFVTLAGLYRLRR